MSAFNPLLAYHERMRQLDGEAELYSGLDILANHNFAISGLVVKNAKPPRALATRVAHGAAGFDVINIHPIVRTILAENPNVVLSGGSILCMMHGIPVNDWDLFILGGKSWETVNNICKTCKAQHIDAQITISRGLINITIDQMPRKIHIQIILRAIPSISALLHGFDLPHCGVAFDGRRSYFTRLALIAIQTNTIFISVKYYSPTFHKRIAKYVERFNYNMCFLDIPGTIKPNAIRFCKLKLTIKDGLIESLEPDNYQPRSEGYFIDTLKKCITPVPIVNTYSHEIHYPSITSGQDIYIMANLHYMIPYKEDFNYDGTYGDLIRPYDFRRPTNDIIHFYKFVFRSIFKIFPHLASPFLAIKCVFDRNTIKDMIAKKITLRDACYIARDQMDKKLNTKMEYWIIDNPSSQFDMRLEPLEIDPATAYHYE